MLAAWLFVSAVSAWGAAPLGTAFTYQGKLELSGSRVNDTCDCQFSLWDDLNGGSQVSPTLTFDGQGGNPPPIAVADGLFTVALDFGAGVINGEQRWLQIAVACPSGGTLQPLAPRQHLTAAPYALYALSGPGGTGGFWTADGTHIHNTNPGNVGIGTVTPNSLLAVRGRSDTQSIRFEGPEGNFRFLQQLNSSDQASWAFRTDSSGSSDVVIGTEGQVGIGTTNPTAKLEVIHPAATGIANAVSGQSASTFGRGVTGHTTSPTGFTVGVLGQSDSDEGTGVLGYALAATGVTYGGWFESNSTHGRGVYGQASSTGSGLNYGVYGDSAGTAGHGVFGLATAASGINFGVRGRSDSTSGRGVYGRASAATGTNYGVRGRSDSPSGFDFYASGAGMDYGAESSIRWKNNVEPIDRPLEKIARLRGVTYDWDAEHGGHHDVGMIAEEVGTVLPEIVQYEENGIDAIGMDYSKLTPLLVEAVKELNRTVEEKDAQISQLTARLERIENLLANHTPSTEDRK